MQDQLREEMARETVTGLLDQLRASAKIEKFNIDGSKIDPAAAKPPVSAPGAAKPAAPSPGK
jgi:peptidyl-prolyl cis-trans isomerase C